METAWRYVQSALKEGEARIRAEAGKYGQSGEALLAALPRGASRGTKEWPFLNGSLRETQNIEKLLNGRKIPNTCYKCRSH